MSRAAIGAAVVLAALGLAALVPVAAIAHGDEETAIEAPQGGAEPGGAGEAMSEEAEVEALAIQPARILAQQALAELKVRGDAHEAAVRLDAALKSEDQSDVDVMLLREATETLDGGDPEGAIPLLDRALSRPLGQESGEALHEAGREFQPSTGSQEVVAIILGAVAVLLGGLLLARGRRVGGQAP